MKWINELELKIKDLNINDPDKNVISTSLSEFDK
jgi:hypothetical protein